MPCKSSPVRHLVSPKPQVGMMPHMWLNPAQLESNLQINNASDYTEGLPSTRSTHTPAYPSPTTQHTPLTTDGKAIQVSRPSGNMMSFSPRVLREFYTSLPKTTRDELRELAKTGDFSFVDAIKSQLVPGNNLSSQSLRQSGRFNILSLPERLAHCQILLLCSTIRKL